MPTSKRLDDPLPAEDPLPEPELRPRLEPVLDDRENDPKDFIDDDPDVPVKIFEPVGNVYLPETTEEGEPTLEDQSTLPPQDHQIIFEKQNHVVEDDEEDESYNLKHDGLYLTVPFAPKQQKVATAKKRRRRQNLKLSQLQEQISMILANLAPQEEKAPKAAPTKQNLEISEAYAICTNAGLPVPDESTQSPPPKDGRPASGAAPQEEVDIKILDMAAEILTKQLEATPELQSSDDEKGQLTSEQMEELSRQLELLFTTQQQTPEAELDDAQELDIKDLDAEELGADMIVRKRHRVQR